LAETPKGGYIGANEALTYDRPCSWCVEEGSLVEGLEEVDQAHGVERASQLFTCLQQDSCSVSRTIQQRDYERSGFSQLDHLAQRVVAEFGFFTLVNQRDTWTKPR